jgi:L-cysteine desulfidase
VGDEADDDIQLNFPMVYEFATTAPLDEISFILKTRDYNMKAAELSIKGNYGHCLGKTMDRPLSHGIFGDNIFSHIISRTAPRVVAVVLRKLQNQQRRFLRHWKASSPQLAS